MSELPTLRVLNLYPEEMNIYGDTGNILALTKRAQLHAINCQVVEYNVGDQFPDNIDIIIGGGGQDSGQANIQTDIQTIAGKLKQLAIDNVPMLMICGLYQLFGHEFVTTDKTTIRGIGIFDMTTAAGAQRLIGNVTAHSQQFGDLVGYENHSGLTHLGDSAQPLASVAEGMGNNGQDGSEGARFNNVIGSYLHGPLLPKNPNLTDFLIQSAAERKFGHFKPARIDDGLIDKVRQTAAKRPR